MGVVIEQRGERLTLRATLPPKASNSRSKACQQRIYLGFHANPAGLKEAELEARKVGTLLERREFDWTPYLKAAAALPDNCEAWIDRYEVHYLAEGGTAATWEGDYWKVYKHLRSDATLDPIEMKRLIDATSANSKTRTRTCMALGALARFAGVDYDPSVLRGNYSPSKVKRRELPDDELIAWGYEQITNPAWRWVYGMMATYGLRNHEVFYLKLEQFPIVEVTETTKTGTRQVFPCYPEWAKQWNLSDRVLPPVDLNRSNDKIGHSVTKYLSPKLPFVPYDLRHAWAIRTLEFGFPIELAARQMGHSVAVHERTYHRWITAKHYQRMYEVLMSREDRPKPPVA